MCKKLDVEFKSALQTCFLDNSMAKTIHLIPESFVIYKWQQFIKNVKKYSQDWYTITKHTTKRTGFHLP